MTFQLPAYLQGACDEEFTKQLRANLGSRSQPYLSIEGDRLTLIDSSGDMRRITTVDPQTGDPYIDCVIIDSNPHSSKIWYGRDYELGAETYSPPRCWSDNGIAPSTACSDPQALSCKEDPTNTYGCKWACWGSGRARAGSTTVPPACAKVQKVALLIPGDPLQYLLRVPPKSLEQLSAYNDKFIGQPFNATIVMTRISISNKVLYFKGLGLIDEALARQRAEILAAKRTDILVGRGDQPRQAAIESRPMVKMPELAASYEVNQLSVPTASSPASALVEQSDPLFAQIAVAPSIATAPASTPTANPAPAASPSSEAPKRRRGRPAKAQAGTPVSAETSVAPFRQDHPSGNGSDQPQFGIAPGVAPNAELEAALKSIF